MNAKSVNATHSRKVHQDGGLPAAGTVHAVQARGRRHGLQCTMLGMLIVLFFMEPALANKFETIGSGVSGSFEIKREWLRGFFFTIAVFCVIGALLAIFVPHRNALFLNHRNWKASSITMSIFAILFAGFGFAI